MLKFFFSQPLGLFIKFVLIFPLMEKLSDEARLTIWRMFVWSWLLWSGRFWGDVWVRRGFVDERMVGWSLVRGVLVGEWWTYPVVSNVDGVF
jgi:hypothetical protein